MIIIYSWLLFLDVAAFVLVVVIVNNPSFAFCVCCLAAFSQPEEVFVIERAHPEDAILHYCCFISLFYYFDSCHALTSKKKKMISLEFGTSVLTYLLLYLKFKPVV